MKVLSDKMGPSKGTDGDQKKAAERGLGSRHLGSRSHAKSGTSKAPSARAPVSGIGGVSLHSYEIPKGRTLIKTSDVGLGCAKITRHPMMGPSFRIGKYRIIWADTFFYQIRNES